MICNIHPELVETFSRLASLCRARPGELVVIYGDFNRETGIIGSLYSALRGGQVDTQILLDRVRPPQTDPPESAVACMKKVGMVFDLATNSWLYTRATREILDEGVRMLQVRGSVEGLLSRSPSEVISERARVASRLFNEAPSKEIRIRSADGKQFTASYEGRKVYPQDGLVQEPGDWDSYGTAFANCFPLEDSGDGEILINGPCYLSGGSSFIPRQPFSVTIRKGRIVSVSGGQEAPIFEAWLDSLHDPNLRVVAHVGFGFSEQAGPPPKPVHVRDYTSWECMYGGVIVAFGANLGRRPDHGGVNVAKSHADCILLESDLSIGSKSVIKGGNFVVPGFERVAQGPSVH